MTAPTLHPYRVRCAGLEYVAMAPSACAAIADAITLHGVAGATAAPLRLRSQKGGQA